MSRLAPSAAIVAAFLSVGTPVQAQDNLHPLQLLGGLHRIQDSIARGDRSALALQPELISILDESFRRDFAAGGGLGDHVRSLIIFALGGGGARASSRMLEHVPKSHPDYAIAQATLAYIAGDSEKARQYFAKVDEMTVDVPLSAYVALAKGTVNLSYDKDAAMQAFDHARLLAPGTLVEEVALRRLLSIQLARADPEGFSLTAQQYVHRYIDSPFASQFVKLYVPGIVKLNDTVPHEKILILLASLSHEQRVSILMRLARNAAVAGHLELSAFASAELTREAAGKDTISEARLRLYKSLAAVTSPNAAVAYADLSGINEDDLPAEDRPLLHAALSLASAIVSPVGKSPSLVQPQPMPKPEPTTRQVDSQSVETMAETGRKPLVAESDTGETAAAKALDISVDSLLASARKKLKSIDKMIDE